MSLEYNEDGLLIVDGFYYDPAYSNGWVVNIGDSWYMIADTETRQRPIKKEALRPYKKKLEPKKEKQPEYSYITNNMIPREGFSIEPGRPITSEEFDELCKKYNLADDTVSGEFGDRIGSIYGEKYTKYFKSIQIKVGPGEAIPLEGYLRNKGIEAFNGSPGRVNIRTDWGGYREGAGRKATGRKIARIYVTEEEEKKLRDYLEKIRNGENA
ncbi:hypothetical protein [Muricomes intestini]|uniref:hypothetical protein n=1 Tax=Muricomes intestini TaxID=1796634 RepID=UPI002FDE5F19